MMQRVKDWIRPLAVDRLARTLLIIALIANVLAWALLLVRLWPLLTHNSVIALHYSIYIGVNDVGRAGWALLTPLVGLLALGVNAALARIAYVRARIPAIVFLGVTALYEFAVLAAAVFVVLSNLKY